MSYFSGVNSANVRSALKPVTFTGGAGVGAVGSVALFTVTGRVLVHLIAGFCTTDLTEAGATATITLGTTNQTTVFIGSTNAVNIDANEWWASTTPTVGAIDSADAIGSVLVSENIIATVGSQNVNGGVLEVYALWEPLSAGASLVAA